MRLKDYDIGRDLEESSVESLVETPGEDSRNFGEGNFFLALGLIGLISVIPSKELYFDSWGERTRLGKAIAVSVELPIMLVMQVLMLVMGLILVLASLVIEIPTALRVLYTKLVYE